MHLISPTNEVSAALKSLHVLDLFDIRDDHDAPPPKWEPFPDSEVDCHSLGKLVVEAHEELIDADDRNAPTFRPVVDGLKAEMQKRRTAR